MMIYYTQFEINKTCKHYNIIFEYCEEIKKHGTQIVNVYDVYFIRGYRYIGIEEIE